MNIQAMIILCAVMGAGILSIISWEHKSRWSDRLLTVLFGALVGAGLGIAWAAIMVMLSLLIIILF